MEVVTNGVSVRPGLECWRIALCHIEEAHGRRAFTGRQVGKVSRLRLAVRSGTDRHFDPREKVPQTPGGIPFGRMTDRAIRLLPHLIEAVYRARGVGIVGQVRAGELKRATRQC